MKIYVSWYKKSKFPVLFNPCTASFQFGLRFIVMSYNCGLSDVKISELASIIGNETYQCCAKKFILVKLHMKHTQNAQKLKIAHKECLVSNYIDIITLWSMEKMADVVLWALRRENDAAKYYRKHAAAMLQFVYHSFSLKSAIGV